MTSVTIDVNVDFQGMVDSADLNKTPDGNKIKISDPGAPGNYDKIDPFITYSSSTQGVVSGSQISLKNGDTVTFDLKDSNSVSNRKWISFGQSNPNELTEEEHESNTKWGYTAHDTNVPGNSSDNVTMTIEFTLNNQQYEATWDPVVIVTDDPG